MTTTAPRPLPDGVLDAEDLARCLLPLGPARTLPTAAYTDPRVLAWERRNLFAGSWTCVGRDADLRADGVRAAGRHGRRRAGAAALGRPTTRRRAAFANTCRHRGHELLAGRAGSTNRSLVCPYHAWTYALDGALRAAPGFREDAAFDPSAHGLVELPLRRWRGWLFVHALATPHRTGGAVRRATSAPSTTSSAPYAPERLHLRRPARLRGGGELEGAARELPRVLPLPADPPRAVPGLAADAPATTTTCPARGSAARWSCATAWRRCRSTGASGGAAIPGADPARVEYVGLLPNLLVSAHPDYVMTHRLTPLDAGPHAVECAWYLVDPDGRTRRTRWSSGTSRTGRTGRRASRSSAAWPHRTSARGRWRRTRTRCTGSTTLLASAYLGRPLHEAPGAH